MFDIAGIFATMATLTAAVLAGSELIDRFWHLEGVPSQVRALGVGLALGEVGAGLGLGMFTDPAVCGTNVWYVCGGLIGLVSGLVGNFAFATPLGKWILELLKIRPKERNS